MGRWLSLDPLQHKYPDLSPYNFVQNNPLMFIDPSGKDIKPSAAFNASVYKPVLDNLRDDNSAFVSLLGEYNNDNNADIRLKLDINNAKVPPGAEAVTSWPSSKLNSKGKVTAVTASIYFRTTSGKKENSLGRATLLIHEVVHAYAAKDGRSGSDAKHTVWDDYLPLMQKVIKEYSEDNNLDLSETQITELSIFNAGKGANIYDNYIKDLATKNKTTIDKEMEAFNERINALTKESKESTEVPTETNSDEAPPSEPTFKKPN